MANIGERYKCSKEGCGCEITIDKLPDDYGALGSEGMEFNAATFGGGPDPKCPFCESATQQITS